MIHPAMLNIVKCFLKVFSFRDIELLFLSMPLYLNRCYAYNHLAGLFHFRNEVLVGNL